MKKSLKLISSAALLVAAFVFCTAFSPIIKVDTHTDTAIEILRGKANVADLQVNFDKMREGGLDVVFFAIYKGQGICNDSARVAVPKWTEEQLVKFNKYIDDHSDIAGKACNVADVRRLKAEGKAIAILALENGYQVGKDLSNLQKFYDLGVRYITLSHNNHNDVCDSDHCKNDPSKGFQIEPKWHGLSPFGEEVVKEMNRLGIIIDISHTADETVEDVLAISKAPIIATHSCCRELSGRDRNLPDDLIRRIGEKGGVVSVTIVPSFLKMNDPKSADVKTFCDHVEHVRDIAGIEHVGFGSDFDGGGGVPGINSALEVQNVTDELIRRGWSEAELKLFWGENILRVMSEVEKCAEK